MQSEQLIEFNFSFVFITRIQQKKEYSFSISKFSFYQNSIDILRFNNFIKLRIYIYIIIDDISD